MSLSQSGLFTFPEFQKRGVIKLAPDVLVYIGGSLELQVVAPVSSKGGQLNFDDGITNVNVQNNVDPPGSSTATIEIAAPIYGENSKYWVPYQTEEGNLVRLPVFVPMMEVKVYFKGRFLVGGKGQNEPQYYPQFWGFISSVEENYSGGVWKISLHCVDILHWWAYSRITVHPVPESNTAAGGGQTLTVYSTIFNDANPFTIITRLFGNMGMNEFVAPTWLAQQTPLSTIYPPDQFHKAATHIMDYWRSRLGNLGGLLKMYGVLGERVTPKGDIQVLQYDDTPQPSTAKTSKSQKGTEPQNYQNFKVNTSFLRNFSVFFDFAKMGKFDQAETLTKLEIATEVKTRCDYEFFQDVNGNFVFKPPFFNMDVRGIQPYEIEPYDVINCSFSIDSEGICTVLQIHTPMQEHYRTTAFARGEGFHMDIELAQKYGVRFQDMHVEYLFDKKLARSMAVAQMNQINSKTESGSITIPGRPELKLGFPVYVRHRDSFHYVKSLNHSFDYAGSFTTTLSLETERKRQYNIDAQNNYSLQVDSIYNFNSAILPVTDSIVGAPKISDTNASDQKSQTLLANEGRIVSLRQGRYSIVHRSLEAEKVITETSIPFTDEAGYRVIGAFPYGRGMNPLAIDSNTINYSYAKSAPTNITTEAANMSKVFFTDKEGIVPRYIQEGTGPLNVPSKSTLVASFSDPQTTTNTTSQSVTNQPDSVPTIIGVQQAKSAPGIDPTNLTPSNLSGSTVSSQLVNKQ